MNLALPSFLFFVHLLAADQYLVFPFWRCIRWLRERKRGSRGGQLQNLAHSHHRLIASAPPAPRCTGDGVDLARGDLHRERIPRREADPERLALIHGHDDPAALEPGGRSRRGKVVQGTERERAEAGGERVSPAVVGNPQGALKGDGQCRERCVVQSGGAQSRGAQGGLDLVRRQGQHPEAMPRLTKNPVILSLSKDL